MINQGAPVRRPFLFPNSAKLVIEYSTVPGAVLLCVDELIIKTCVHCRFEVNASSILYYEASPSFRGGAAFPSQVSLRAYGSSSLRLALVGIWVCQFGSTC